MKKLFTILIFLIVSNINAQSYYRDLMYRTYIITDKESEIQKIEINKFNQYIYIYAKLCKYNEDLKNDARDGIIMRTYDYGNSDYQIDQLDDAYIKYVQPLRSDGDIYISWGNGFCIFKKNNTLHISYRAKLHNDVLPFYYEHRVIKNLHYVIK